LAKCSFCGGKADLLCDSWLGWESMRGKMQAEAPNLRLADQRHVPQRFRAIHTCDAPLCRACATPGGTFIAHFKGGRMVHDSWDFCPGHGRGSLRTEITGLQAQAMRAAWRAKAAIHRDGPPAQQLGLFTSLIP
jgi:hypothetical protein